MDYNIIIIIAVLVAVLGGFIVSCRTILDKWKVGSRVKEAVDARQTKGK